MMEKLSSLEKEQKNERREVGIRCTGWSGCWMMLQREAVPELADDVVETHVDNF